ncbi:protocadherin-18a isoform X2 [Electrophorus electricus]|uniref:protocadherin-18a isoform X2 n=1 Tax=Electrophorus electricus TaxID=8005 RepID=UPI0015D0CB0A|nr:protocadherin-18a isoform X2 [Electrophorus electricus]
MHGNKDGLLVSATLVLLVAQHAAGKTLKYQVYEEQKVGTLVGRLKEDAADVLANLPGSVPLRFRAMQRGSATALSVRDQDGEIAIKSRLDREKLCEKNLNCSIEFDVLTLPTEHLQLFHVEVEILDINDNAPQFSRSVIPIEISETAAVGTRIPLDSASDPDVGENSLDSYSLTPSEFFKIDVLTRTNGAKYAELVVLKELDREMRASYELQLTASDRGVPPKFGTTLLKISVADSNDNNPVFEKPSYVISLPENSPMGTLLLDLNATDPDEGTNGKIVYSFSSHVSPKVTETFKINQDNGQLSLLRKVDFEAAESYDIDVQAQDMGPNAMPAHCKVIVKVVDVNDNRPEISVTLMSTAGEEVAAVSEGAAPDTFVALVSVDDADTGANGEVVCRLHGQGDFRLQKTHERNFMILTNGSLDREQRAEYTLTVVAEDRGSPSLSAARHILVRVLDENDNAPRFDRSAYEIFKAENNSPGAYLGAVQASDLDQGPNGQLSYSVVESQVQGSSVSTYVTVDPSSGALYALRSFDREDVPRVSFLVQARDSGSPALSSTVSVTMTVLDVNDNRPVILAPPLWNHTADVPVSRYTEAGELVTVVRATDRDTGANGELVCSLVGGNEAGYFSMDGRTCEIRANRSLRDAPAERAELAVLVRDQGSEPLAARAVLRLTLYENVQNAADPRQTGGGAGGSPLDASMLIIISLGVVCGLLLMVMVGFALRCARHKDPRTYNCRVAETTYQPHPRRPEGHLHKGDITLVPTVNGTLPSRSHRRSPAPSPSPQRAHMNSGQSPHSHQSLNSLVTISSSHIPEGFALELTHATPPVERVSQLLSLLHQGQYQPRPSYRGNKHSRTFRYALPDMDKFSLKDSGRGDSDAGDSDCEIGRDSPIDRLLGDGFGDLFHIDGNSRLHSVVKLCSEECRVLGHSDQCWMPSLVSTDYRANMFIPGEESHTQVVEDDQQSLDSNRKSFSTFGKDAEDEEDGGSSLLSEMNTVFQHLLPSSYVPLTELSEGSAPSSVAAETRKGFLLAKVGGACAASSIYPQGVAAWAANTHFQNPSGGGGGGMATGHSSTNHASAQMHTKWLPAMEEIPENREEDEVESALYLWQSTQQDGPLGGELAAASE